VDDAIQPEYLVARARLDAPVHLDAYDEAWPEVYASVDRRVRSALSGQPILVEHVGSTAVPGLPAKPVIDVLLLVGDPTDENAYVPALEQQGFELRIREPEWFEHRLLRGTAPDVNLHVFAVDSPEARRMLTFRDHLRTHPDDRDRYAQTKTDLAAQTWAYMQDYADAKTAIVQDILRRASSADA
jgi:GrpB-like predicted nucleotidyltransferase (UPF0157 family)